MVNCQAKTLISKTISGNGGSGSQEPYYTLVFEGDIKQNKDWDVIFEEESKEQQRKEE